MRFLVVGAGVSGAVVGRVLAEGGHHVVVVDERPHIAGNCYTERDEATGVMAHKYGPHLFHTSRRHVVDFLKQHGTWIDNQHRVKATTESGVFSMPINLLTLNQFFGVVLGPDEMRDFVAQRTITSNPVKTFEDQALAMVGRELYREFFEGYTAKQWGRDPATLPAEILRRLPMRFTYSDRYFSDEYEMLPADGYTEVVASILDHPDIEVSLDHRTNPRDTDGFDHTIWTGPIDAFFDWEFGRLPYRTLDFDWQVHDFTYQGCSVMNYCSSSVPFTRISEHNYFEPWRDSSKSLIAVETSREAGDLDIPYYPVHLSDGNELLARYLEHARAQVGVTFLGRLGTFRYLDMDAAISEALAAGRQLVNRITRNETLPAFCDTHDSAGQS